MRDWTRSPYVALYFAFAEPLNKTSQRVVWLLHGAEACKINPDIEVFSPLSDENSRLMSQDGLFTYISTGGALDQKIPISWEDSDPKPVNPVLIKVCLPEDQRTSILVSLNRMNINYGTLFPDLYGASNFCNMKALIPGY